MTDKLIAPEGAIWVCGACGKTSDHLYGEGEKNYGWDISCSINATLCRNDESLKLGENGLVTQAEAWKEDKA